MAIRDNGAGSSGWPWRVAQRLLEIAFTGMICGFLFNLAASLFDQYKAGIVAAQLQGIGNAAAGAGQGSMVAAAVILLTPPCLLVFTYLYVPRASTFFRVASYAACSLFIGLAAYVLILFFASECMIRGVADGNKTQVYHDPGTCLYFSMITWSGTGFGDFKPTDALRMFAATESLVSYLFMAFLVACLTRALFVRRRS